MVQDAKFEDGDEKRLNLKAVDAEDLEVLSSLIQDAVFPVTEMKWDRKKRRFALLLNRFRWEDVGAATMRKRNFERVQSLVAVDDVLSLSSQGIDRTDKEVILSVLTLAFEPGEDGTGRLLLTLAGDGAIAIEVEALDITLKDVTRPYVAPSRKKPSHP